MAEDKTAILLRIPTDKKQAFDDLYPWHGSISQFFLQSLDVMLELSKDQKSPATLTSESVSKLFREQW